MADLMGTCDFRGEAHTFENHKACVKFTTSTLNWRPVAPESKPLTPSQSPATDGLEEKAHDALIRLDSRKLFGQIVDGGLTTVNFADVLAPVLADFARSASAPQSRTVNKEQGAGTAPQPNQEWVTDFYEELCELDRNLADDVLVILKRYKNYYAPVPQEGALEHHRFVHYNADELAAHPLTLDPYPPRLPTETIDEAKAALFYHKHREFWIHPLAASVVAGDKDRATIRVHKAMAAYKAAQDGLFETQRVEFVRLRKVFREIALLASAEVSPHEAMDAAAAPSVTPFLKFQTDRMSETEWSADVWMLLPSGKWTVLGWMPCESQAEAETECASMKAQYDVSIATWSHTPSPSVTEQWAGDACPFCSNFHGFDEACAHPREGRVPKFEAELWQDGYDTAMRRVAARSRVPSPVALTEEEERAAFEKRYGSRPEYRDDDIGQEVWDEMLQCWLARSRGIQPAPDERTGYAVAPESKPGGAPVGTWIWSCVNCRARIQTTAHFHINFRPICCQCNAEMEPYVPDVTPLPEAAEKICEKAKTSRALRKSIRALSPEPAPEKKSERTVNYDDYDGNGREKVEP